MMCHQCTFDVCHRCLIRLGVCSTVYASGPTSPGLPRKPECNNGHAMLWVVSNSPYTCDQCQCLRDGSVARFKCGDCDYDVCLRCSMTSPRGGARPPAARPFAAGGAPPSAARPSAAEALAALRLATRYTPGPMPPALAQTPECNNRHPMRWVASNTPYNCDQCRVEFEGSIARFKCSDCDYDVCKRCCMTESSAPSPLVAADSPHVPHPPPTIMANVAPPTYRSASAGSSAAAAASSTTDSAKVVWQQLFGGAGSVPIKQFKTSLCTWLIKEGFQVNGKNVPKDALNSAVDQAANEANIQDDVVIELNGFAYTVGDFTVKEWVATFANASLSRSLSASTNGNLSASSSSTTTNGRSVQYEYDAFDDIVLGDEIARGAFSVVRRGKHLKKGHNDLAVKVITVGTDTIASVLHEIELHLQLRHANIIDIRGMAVSPDMCMVLLLMQRAEGGSLHHLIHANAQKIIWRRVYQFLSQIIDALMYLHGHEQKIIHRDLKSANVLLNVTHDDICLCDFGLATRASVGGGKWGTLAWMAPELFLADATHTEMSDMFALGVIAWELVTGKVPFGGMESELIEAKASQNDREPIPSTTPPNLAKFITDCTRTRPSDRCTKAMAAQCLVPPKEFGSSPAWVAAAPARNEATAAAMVADASPSMRPMALGANKRKMK